MKSRNNQLTLNISLSLFTWECIHHHPLPPHCCCNHCHILPSKPGHCTAPARPATPPSTCAHSPSGACSRPSRLEPWPWLFKDKFVFWQNQLLISQITQPPIPHPNPNKGKPNLFVPPITLKLDMHGSMLLACIVLERKQPKIQNKGRISPHNSMNL